MGVDELECLKEQIEDKSKHTIRSYIVQYKKLTALLEADICDSSEEKVIKFVKEQTSINSQQALLNIAIVVRRLHCMPTEKLESNRESNKVALVSQVKMKNAQIINNLPSLLDLQDYTQYLYDENKYTDYVINFLLLNAYVRNQDLNFELVSLKRNTKNNDKNYMWLSKNKATFIRNVYKTSGTYGKLVNVFTDRQLIIALRRIMACQNYNEDCGVFIPNENQIGYYIKQSTFQGIGEAKYLKIIIDANRGNLQKLKEISDSRGTNIETLISNYDINLQ